MRIRKTNRRRHQPTQPEPLLMPVRQAAAMLGCGVAKTKQLIKSGRLDGVMLGPFHFVKTSSVKRFAEHGE